MTPEQQQPPERSYGCTFACGNPYDVIVIMVADGTTEFLCIPCYVKMATDMITAITEADDPNVRAALEWATANSGEPVPGPSAKRGKHNAPATNEDPDLIEAFADVITVDELPEEFR